MTIGNLGHLEPTEKHETIGAASKVERTLPFRTPGRYGKHEKVIGIILRNSPMIARTLHPKA